MRRRYIAIISCMLASTALAQSMATQPAEKPTREALDAFYDHGEKFIPVPSHAAAMDGYIFSLDKGSFGKLPLIPKEITTGEKQIEFLVTTMRKQKTGDIFYNLSGKTPVLLVVSGKARDLGKHYIFDFNTKVIDPPGEWPAADEVKKIPVTGWIENPKVGHVYIIETLAGNHALFRIITAGEGGVVIQWVSAGGKMAGANWDLPGSMTSVADDLDVSYKAPTTLPARPPETRVASVTPVELRNPPVAVQTQPKTPVTLPQTIPSTVSAPPTSTFVIRPNELGPGATLNPGKVAAILRDRDNAIQFGLVALVREVKLPKDRIAKAQAMIDMGNLAAVEAVDQLIAQINFIDPNDESMQGDTMKLHPAVGALVKIGKPASTAALKAMHTLKPGGNALNTPEYRATLLTYVIHHVEGNETAEFLLKRELGKTDSDHKLYFEQGLREIKTNPIP